MELVMSHKHLEVKLLGKNFEINIFLVNLSFLKLFSD